MKWAWSLRCLAHAILGMCKADKIQSGILVVRVDKIVEVKVIGNGHIVEMLENGADLCVSEGQALSEHRVSLADG